MPQYTINDTGKEVIVKKSPPPPKGLKKLEIELTKAITKALEVAFCLVEA